MKKFLIPIVLVVIIAISFFILWFPTYEKVHVHMSSENKLLVYPLADYRGLCSLVGGEFYRVIKILGEIDPVDNWKDNGLCIVDSKTACTLRGGEMKPLLEDDVFYFRKADHVDKEFCYQK